MKIVNILCAVACIQLMSADIVYETTTTTSGFLGIGGSETHAVVFIKGDWSRKEATSTDSLLGGVTDITITRLDDGVIWHLDMENECYSEEKVCIEVDSTKAAEEQLLIPEITVEHTGNKKTLLEKECGEVIVKMKVKKEDRDIDYTQTMWVTSDIPGYAEIMEFNQKRSEMELKPSSGVGGVDEQSLKAFQEEVNKIEGFPLELTIDMTMGVEEMTIDVQIHSVVYTIDEVPINERVFEIPVGFTKKN